ncbi:MAG TPA: ribosome silencing factor [Acidimicrobiales bacterium]|nr:ribosome silencing factor [Acidimicrobiales bacterium]
MARLPTNEEHDTLTNANEPTSIERAVAACRAADEKQGSDTIGLDVGGVLSIVDWFVITSAANPRQVRTIADEVEARLKAGDGTGALRREGLDDARWVLLDFGDVVVHVFLEEVRAFYELERLWADVGQLEWREAEAPAAAAAD